uniref:ribosomal protein L22 n=1 Tax=Wallichia oblongifolia TaxID=1056965 RepID=UPI0025520D52|nr:ribosomal protein L22 [Wallichia oblongifolia]WGM71868.1 ribosomal protein L22 [Wallichia oblongifolia]WGM71953.1 ribosomal protein L22 [Wallichia oblongifolia]WGM72038.1 ribosomal protein L22 [Wallichia oblongifolia]
MCCKVLYLLILLFISLVGDDLMIKNWSSGREENREIKVLAQHICMSVLKAQRVIDQIRGRSYEETLMILELMPYRASYPILQLVYSAAANANHNMGLNEADSFISKAEVNRSAIVKKLRARARGRSYPIKKPTCHITIVLKEKSKSF